ncbi:calcium-binding protein [Aquaspirillum serpens]|uniref:calcium-binding protein n=1 Tax=Aquaspirillum serpens TaxID=190 RepID=UPI0003B4F9D7|nr:calcium-binding protein [Aquaspirillum serpens]
MVTGGGAAGAGSTYDNLSANANQTGTANADTFNVTATSFNGTINGAAGADVLNFTDAAGTGFTLSNVSAVETINFAAGLAASTITYSSDTTVAAGQTLTINASQAVGAITANFAAETDGNINVTTGFGNDIVTGGAGNDTIDSGLGADTVTAGDGNNTINTGAGADNVSAGDGNNTINTGADGDQISVGNGNNNLISGDGADSITAGNGNNTVDGGAGNDQITVGNGNNTINGGAGNDSITVGTGTNTVDGGAGTDTINVANSTLALGADKLTSISNFVVADDTLQTGVAGVATYTLNVATSDFTSFVGNANNAIAALGGGYAAVAGNVFIVNVAAGSATGQYLVQHRSVSGTRSVG